MLNLTVVTKELVWVDGMLLIEMTDDSITEMRVSINPFAGPLVWGDESRRWRYQTLDWVRNELSEIAAIRKDVTNAALHADKVRRLGWDYSARGYR